MTGPDVRPALHFTAREGWINDPLGLTFHDGRYHLFFQHVPGTTRWATEQHWGHATSADLRTWTEHDVALSPGEGDDGVWSGCVVTPDDGPAVLFYTAARRPDTHIAPARVAHPTDVTWSTWRKGDDVAAAPPGVDVVALRDPYVLHDGTGWLMLLGAGLADGTATALVYRSDDLRAWSYDGLLAGRHSSETEPWTGEMWECPQLFRLGDRWVLTVSVWSEQGPFYEAYAVGDLVDGRFAADSWERLTYGESLYAGAAFVDRVGRRGLIHWLRDAKDPHGRWAGAHSLPHLLELDPATGRVRVTPHPAVVEVGGDAEPVDGEAAVRGPIEVRWTPSSSGALALRDGEGELLRLATDGGRLTATTAHQEWPMPATGELCVVVDGPVVEVFGDRGVLAVTLDRPASALALFGGGTATVRRLGPAGED